MCESNGAQKRHHTMTSYGIDVGSDSIRVCGKRGEQLFFAERPVHRKVQGNRHTMSTEEMWARIEEMVAEGNHELGTTAKEKNGVCVAATCSMAVMEKIVKDGNSFYRPLDDVIVWMDGRAGDCARWVNSRMPKEALELIGGQVTPEMGVAKLKWVDQAYRGRDVVVFELYDWISYLFMAGGVENGLVRCLPGDIETYLAELSAMDGLIKGWSAAVLTQLDVQVKVGCAPSGGCTKSRIPAAGTELGPSKALINGTVHHGCIDCYGVVLEEVKSTQQRSSLSMVAGTSTCFIAAVPDAKDPVEGMWGPFPQLGHKAVYSFGQPATGTLFAPFFGARSAAEVESLALAVEAERGCTWPVLARNHLYYGDKHGNRSPYGDFSMDEVVVSGHNADGNTKDHENDNFKELRSYYLTMEFLVFQTKQMVELLVARKGSFDVVTVHGSQAGNGRMMRMLKHFVFAGAPLLVARSKHSKYAGAQGCCHAVTGCADLQYDELVYDELSADELAVLEKKYSAFLELAAWQRRFRTLMA